MNGYSEVEFQTKVPLTGFRQPYTISVSEHRGWSCYETYLTEKETSVNSVVPSTNEGLCHNTFGYDRRDFGPSSSSTVENWDDKSDFDLRNKSGRRPLPRAVVRGHV